MKNTKIISAFPACGKTYVFENFKDKIILDSEQIEKENNKNVKEIILQSNEYLCDVIRNIEKEKLINKE